MKSKIIILGALVLFASAAFINNTLAGGTDRGQPGGQSNNMVSIESAYPKMPGQNALKPDKRPRPPELDKEDKPPKPEKIKPPKLDKRDKPPKAEKSEKAHKPDKLPKPPKPAKEKKK